ncbi:MAG: nucleoside triphosphate pyrophosphohydrolase [Thermodesulfobacteriota bacterium]|nr:nucleoside triphosphate pyrophosphohydrolase [Thermodesulfobacteriota bacterium]
MGKTEKSHTSQSLESLVDIVRTLRGENGCPWDRKQTPETMWKCLAEEVYELLEAIEDGDPGNVCEETGDVLFQLVFIAELYREKGDFNIAGSISKVREKMIRRHPHVYEKVYMKVRPNDCNDRLSKFVVADENDHAPAVPVYMKVRPNDCNGRLSNFVVADENDHAPAVPVILKNEDELREQWERIKKEEKKEAGKSAAASVLDSVPSGMPALLRSYKISERAVKAGFDWDDMSGVLKKVEEEWQEFGDALATGDKEAIATEFGDILFTLANVARFAGIHPETSLAKSTDKFEKRFRYMEREIGKKGAVLKDYSRQEIDILWEKAKKFYDCNC